jgi:NurA-like 5'-3' nuclease
MTRRTITILLVITAIVAVVAFTTLKKEKAIEKVLLSDSYSTETGDSAETVRELNEFESSSDIYAVIMLKNITPDDSISIQWKRIEENGELLIQEDSVIEKQEGSGPLIISFAKKNDIHEAGKYKIYVKLNESEAIEKTFTVKKE